MERLVRQRGRPRTNISAPQLQHLRLLGYNWTQIAQTYGVSPKTIYRARNDLGCQDDVPTDDNLYSAIRELVQQTPDAGEAVILGGLRSRGIHATRKRVRAVLTEVDPENRAYRRYRAIRRREYHVPGPNHLW